MTQNLPEDDNKLLPARANAEASAFEAECQEIMREAAGAESMRMMSSVYEADQALIDQIDREALEREMDDTIEFRAPERHDLPPRKSVPQPPLEPKPPRGRTVSFADDD